MYINTLYRVKVGPMIEDDNGLKVLQDKVRGTGPWKFFGGFMLYGDKVSFYLGLIRVFKLSTFVVSRHACFLLYVPLFWFMLFRFLFLMCRNGHHTLNTFSKHTLFFNVSLMCEYLYSVTAKLFNNLAKNTTSPLFPMSRL